MKEAPGKEPVENNLCDFPKIPFSVYMMYAAAHCFMQRGAGMDRKTDVRKEPAERQERSTGRRLLSGMMSLVYPPDIYCLACGRPVDPGHVYSLCEDCLNEITWADRKTCRVCGKPLESWYPAELCSECLVSPRAFERGVICFLYKGGARSMMKDLKYHGRKYNARIFGQILADKILYEGLDFDLCVPVPMYEKKERTRGYNQAELIAKYAAEKLKKPLAPRALVRTRWTAPMNRLTSQERKRNLRDAFVVPPDQAWKIRGKTVLLVDDIYTTGVTMNTCAQELLKAGAAHIYAAAMASGRNQRELPEEGQS